MNTNTSIRFSRTVQTSRPWRFLVVALLLACPGGFANAQGGFEDDFDAYGSDEGGDFQEGYGGGFEGASARRPTMIRILLGPDHKGAPFINYFDLQNLGIQQEQVTMDTTTALPSTMELTVRIGIPKTKFEPKPLEEFKEQIKNHVLRFGIGNIQYYDAEGEDLEYVLSSPVDRGSLNQTTQRLLMISGYVSSDATLELFQRPPADMGMMGMMGMGEMEMGGMEDFGSADYPNIQRRAASASGSLDGANYFLSWSVEKQEAAAISKSRRSTWLRVQLPSKNMLQPEGNDSIVAFLCDNNLYAFSADASRWGVLKLKQTPENDFVLAGSSVSLQTEDDLHIFSAVSGIWQSRSAATNAIVSNSAAGGVASTDPFAASDDSDPFGALGPSSNPFGEAHRNGQSLADPFGGPASSNQSLADPFGGASENPYGGASSRRSSRRSDGPFDADDAEPSAGAGARKGASGASGASGGSFGSEVSTGGSDFVESEYEKKLLSLRKESAMVLKSISVLKNKLQEQHAISQQRPVDEANLPNRKRDVQDMLTQLFESNQRLKSLDNAAIKLKAAKIDAALSKQEARKDVFVEQYMERIFGDAK